ncbi:hypothetical protein [Nocardioides rubriscoriae]|uniref:hypothetical protein n=1 Tax=Nocardioides rubriscoriae TaxID=642762 RepID=UPI0011DF2AF1|nr:hypothetical protein [Nocardioides rubriscoriae]
MTDTLKALMDERASAPDFARPDLDVVRAAGTRRRRRRRAVNAGGALAGTAAVTALVVGLTTGGGVVDAGPDVATDVPSQPQPLGPSWAVGTTIHDGDREIQVGHPVRAYVRTSLGFVTVDDRGRVWSVVDAGEEQVGTVDDAEFPRVESDPSSSLVAWVGSQGARRDPVAVVHDQADGTTTTYGLTPVPRGRPSDGTDPTEVIALADGVLYVRDDTRAIAIDLASGDRSVVDDAVTFESGPVDAAAGRVAFVDTTGPTFSVGRTRSTAGPSYAVSGYDGSLSPDAGFVAFTEDDGGVYDTATGTAVDLGLTGFFEPVEWWDATTLALVAESAPGSGVGVLLRCDVVAASCRTVAQLGTFDELGDDFVAPTGSS